MMYDDELYFSPSRKFVDLKWDNPSSIIEDYRERMKSMYIEPAKGLSMMRQTFAAGVMAVCTIDALVKIDLGKIHSDTDKYDYEAWLKNYMTWMNQQDPENRYPNNNKASSIAMRFYKEVRCGIVHEGRMKGGAYFSVARNPPEPVFVYEKSMIVHTMSLLDEIDHILEIILKKADSSDLERAKFVTMVYDLFKDDIESLGIGGG